MHYRIIQTNEELKQVCELASQAEEVALDTEFVRVRTYYPELGLIQLYDERQLVLIDALTITDWQPFSQLLANPKVTKYLHACGEDLDVFHYKFSQCPVALIDSQVVAAFIGHPVASGFARLVADKLEIEMDKSESRTDWTARPLTEAQQHYAAADVYYLLPLARKLVEEVKQKGWFEAALDESNNVCQARLQDVQAEECFYKINNAWRLQRPQLAILRAIAAWRLNYAREKNIAINFVIREEKLWQIAHDMPTTWQQLESSGLNKMEMRRYGNTLLSLSRQAQELTEQQQPPRIERLSDHLQYTVAFKAIKTLLHKLAKQHQLPNELVASRKQINQLLRWHWGENKPKPLLMQGWRGKLFADELTQLLSSY